MEDKTINLVVVDNFFDSEEKIISTLRTVGFTAKSTRAEDIEDLLKILTKKKPDILIFFEGLKTINIKQAIACLKKTKCYNHTRVIVLNKIKSPDVVNAMRQGAVDATHFANLKHLVLIIRREYQTALNSKDILKYRASFRESEKRCNSLLDSSRDAIAYIHEGMHIYSNKSYLEIFAIKMSKELEGIPILDMISPNRRDEFKEFLRTYAKSNQGSTKLDTSLIKPNGDKFNGQMEFSPAQIDGESCIQIIIRKETANSAVLERRLKLLSQRDQLTGLYNRQYCIERLENTIADCEDGKYIAAFMEIHIDNFDNIKESIGVSESDDYIVAAGKTFSKVIKPKDVLSLFTHNKFTLIAFGCNQATAENYATKLQSALIDLEVKLNDTLVNTSCSVGIALINRDTPEHNDILQRSNKALERALKLGSNQVYTYLPKKGELTRSEVDAKYKEQLTQALKTDQFTLHFQPIVSMRGDTNERYEVFIRLGSLDKKELIMPTNFLPAAERVGMSTAIDRWVLYHTLLLCHNHQKSGRETTFFIKLSAPSVKDSTLIDWLSYQLKEKNINANKINFEIKESVAVTHLKNSKILSQKLQALGCGLVLDDFGNGTNPFQLLEHIHADFVRLDASFMDNLTENTQNQNTIRNVANSATERNIDTIIQHVPDASSLSVLYSLNVGFIQGFFLQEPMANMDYDFTEM